MVLAELLKERITEENAGRKQLVLVLLWKCKGIGVEQTRQVGTFHDRHDECLIPIAGRSLDGDAEARDSAIALTEAGVISSSVSLLHVGQKLGGRIPWDKWCPALDGPVGRPVKEIAVASVRKGNGREHCLERHGDKAPVSLTGTPLDGAFFGLAIGQTAEDHRFSNLGELGRLGSIHLLLHADKILGELELGDSAFGDVVSG